MTKLEALTELLGKVEAGEQVGLVAGYCEALPQEFRSDAMLAYTGSLDDAKSLHNAVLLGWVVSHMWGPDGSGNWHVNLTMHCGDPKYAGGVGISPARAWLIAILKALISLEKEA